MSPSQPELSIVIPVRNESPNIGPLYKELVETLGAVVGTHAGPGTVGTAVFQPTAEELALIAPLEEAS